MSVETAIIAVAILAIIAWQVNKRGAWKKAGKVALWVLVVLALVAGAIVGYVYWTVLEMEREWEAEWESEQRELEGLASEGIKSYMGVSLGMQKAEVVYVLGEPQAKKNFADGNSELWIYNNDADTTMISIQFDAGKTVRAIVCAGRYVADCPTLVGISINDSESTIIEHLGPPPSPATIDEDGVKHFKYGPPASGVEFLVRQQNAVSRMGIYREVTEESD